MLRRIFSVGERRLPASEEQPSCSYSTYIGNLRQRHEAILKAVREQEESKALDRFAAAALSATLREDQSSDDAVHQAFEVAEMMLEERSRRRAERAARIADSLNHPTTS